MQDILATILNLAGLKREGVDMQVDWGLPLDAFGADERWGSLGFNILFTYLLSAEQQETLIFAGILVGIPAGTFASAQKFKTGEMNVVKFLIILAIMVATIIRAAASNRRVRA